MKSHGAAGKTIGSDPRKAGYEKPKVGGDTSYRDSKFEPGKPRRNPKQKSAPPR